MLKNANMAKARNWKIYLDYGFLEMTLGRSLNTYWSFGGIFYLQQNWRKEQQVCSKCWKAKQILYHLQFTFIF